MYIEGRGETNAPELPELTGAESSKSPRVEARISRICASAVGRTVSGAREYYAALPREGNTWTRRTPTLADYDLR